jgi:hypothetical protein
MKKSDRPKDNIETKIPPVFTREQIELWLPKKIITRLDELVPYFSHGTQPYFKLGVNEICIYITLYDKKGEHKIKECVLDEILYHFWNANPEFYPFRKDKK